MPIVRGQGLNHLISAYLSFLTGTRSFSTRHIPIAGRNSATVNWVSQILRFAQNLRIEFHRLIPGARFENIIIQKGRWTFHGKKYIFFAPIDSALFPVRLSDLLNRNFDETVVTFRLPWRKEVGLRDGREATVNKNWDHTDMLRRTT